MSYSRDFTKYPVWNKGKKGIVVCPWKGGPIPWDMNHKPHSEKTKKLLSDVVKARWSKIKAGLMEDNFHTKEWENNTRKTHLARWDKIGRTQKRPKHNCSKYTLWRKSVFERDKYVCQHCGARNGFGKTVYFQAHHIKHFAKFPELRYELSNGITLCLPCHKVVHKSKKKQ